MKLLITSLLVSVLALVTATAAPLNVNKKGVAIKGYDPVAYFTQSAAVKGDAAITAEHDGATYHFSSEANRDAFAKNPTKYAPAYGGYCAYGVSKGQLFKIDPKVFTVHDGRLFLQFNRKVAKDYAQNLDANIATSDAKWPSLKK